MILGTRIGSKFQEQSLACRVERFEDKEIDEWQSHI